MRIESNGRVWCGRAIDLSNSSLNAEQIVQAIRDEGERESKREDRIEVTVECARPGALHEHVGWITSGMNLRLRTALAAVARSRGWSAPQDDEQERILEQINALPTATVDTIPARKRLATTRDEIEQQREYVARLHGQVEALRETGAESEPAQEALAALERAIRELSELETERAAAEQAFEQKRERQRRLNDIRDERLALEDRAANVARAAREHLVAQIEDEFERTIETVPGAIRFGFNDHDDDDDDPVTAALAMARLGMLEAPVVLECERFVSARAAAEWMDAPAILL